MYTYKYGAIGEAVRAKIDIYKQNVRGADKTESTFADVLKTYLNYTDTEKKVVSATGSSGTSSAISGSTLLYALQNSDTDTTASTVLSALGFSSSGGSGTDLKTAADSLSASAKQLVELNGAGAENITALNGFVSDFNKVITLLNAESTSSAYLYKNAFGAMFTAMSDELSAAGITYENGYMSYSGSGAGLPDSFLSNVASSAALVSSYAGTIVSDSDTDYSGISEYYSALLSGLM